MKAGRWIQFTARGLAAGLGLATTAYAASAAIAWVGYGHVKRPANSDEDPLLDGFMPVYEVVERHQVHVKAPAETTFASACDMDLQDSAIVSAVFRAREILLRSKREEPIHPRGLLAQMKALGWGVLAETPGREIVMGAVTQPWLPDVVFRPLPPKDFTSFNDPGYARIVWTLRADSVGSTESVFRTETRVATTDSVARAKFRWYWSKVAPGIVLIRLMALRLVKKEAERRVHVKTTP